MFDWSNAMVLRRRLKFPEPSVIVAVESLYFHYRKLVSPETKTFIVQEQQSFAGKPAEGQHKIRVFIENLARTENRTTRKKTKNRNQPNGVSSEINNGRAIIRKEKRENGNSIIRVRLATYIL